MGYLEALNLDASDRDEENTGLVVADRRNSRIQVFDQDGNTSEEARDAA